MSLSGFSFGDKHSSQFNIAVESISRGLLPAKKAETQGFEVTGRHGNVAYNQPIYDVRTISIDIAFLDNTLETLQKRARAIAHWLSATEQLLYFDDEPDLAYTASIFEQIDTAEIITAKKATLNFTCQPFATSINYFQKDYNNVKSGVTMEIKTEGTQKTPCIIMLTNASTSTITSLKFTRKAIHR